MTQPNEINMAEAPSSPPETHHTREEREPSLPPIPAISWDAQTQSFAKRKRSTASHIFSDSSDPAIFSSDDDPALDNYVEGRRNKKRYVGSWFQQHPAPGISDSGITVSHRPASRGKRAFVPVDSGVFMGSDGSIDDILDELPPPPANTKVFPPVLPVLANPSPKLVPAQLNQVPRGSQSSQLSETEVNAQALIRRCIDEGDERVDLSYLGLKHISNSTISLISEIVRIPNVGKGVPFEHQDPELKLFLWNNQLSRVPGALFNLDNLTVLSLRGNDLTEIPPAILQLKNLETLNVSQNNLKHLPIELLELIYDPECSLKSLMLHPNPWYQPKVEGSEHNAPWSSENVDRTQPGPGPQGRGCRWLSQAPLEPRIASYFDAKRWARTPVQFSDTKGMVYSTFRIEADTTNLPTEDLDSEPVIPPRNPAQERVLPSGGARTTKVHSLLELALQACSRNPYLADLPDMLTDTTHTRIRDLLVDTQVHSYTGGVECTVCKRSVIKPTAEWIEWWELFLNYKILGPHADAQNRPRARDPVPGSDMTEELVPRVQYLTQIPEERLVPFIRRACSWKCVQDTVRGLGRQPEEGKD
ncbi:hypothetical protein VMCG_08816 [Cytospora schulzeri]|uniref:Uncharacterized protein n=1 Tax=Cytospora schulzeri TaxID=448051 RepID=A0A423VSB4_9PEZI|nr:hypothetical protein VMCG_08816 [Valsa malicola]